MGISIVLALALSSAAPAPPSAVWKPGFGLATLWNDGNAEVSEYEAREVVEGSPRVSRAVFIVVAEDFRTDRLVKPDRPGGRDAIRVLKLNRVRSIPVGVYRYEQMLSAFLGADRLDAVKLTVLSHDWCGNTFVEWRRDHPSLEIRSYWEEPADVDVPFDPDDALFYDALPLKLRGLDFERTREALVKVVDSLFTNRPARPVIQDGRLAVARAPGADGAWRVTLTRGEHRDVFEFERAFPHRLRSWDRGSDGTLRLVASRRFRYWEKNAPGDERLLSSPGTR